jgi:hypothetical protein
MVKRSGLGLMSGGSWAYADLHLGPTLFFSETKMCLLVYTVIQGFHFDISIFCTLARFIPSIILLPPLSFLNWLGKKPLYLGSLAQDFLVVSLLRFPFKQVAWKCKGAGCVLGECCEDTCRPSDSGLQHSSVLHTSPLPPSSTAPIFCSGFLPDKQIWHPHSLVPGRTWARSQIVLQFSLLLTPL